MTTDMNFSRRTFIKTSIMAGGVAAISGMISKVQTNAAEESDAEKNSISLKGISDIHIHAAPDTKDRLVNELNFAKQAKKAGYRSIMFKSNDWSCHDRAYIIRKAVPEFEVYGSLCMNDVVGDKVNVQAAVKAVKTTGNFCRCIWMPTQNASYQTKTLNQSGISIPVVDEYGKVLPEIIKVMEVCRDNNIIFATGHSSPEESLIMAKKAKEIGVQKFVVTHANSYIWKMTHNQIKKVIDLGGYIEYSYITNLWGKGSGLSDYERMSDEEFINFVKINPERSFITTDLGQPGMPNPIEGMLKCINTLITGGITEKEINLLLKTNPYKLVTI